MFNPPVQNAGILHPNRADSCRTSCLAFIHALSVFPRRESEVGVTRAGDWSAVSLSKAGRYVHAGPPEGGHYVGSKPAYRVFSGIDWAFALRTSGRSFRCSLCMLSAFQ